MVALNFNASQVAPQMALEPVPTGQYPVTITATAEKPTRAGDGSYLEIEMTIANAPDPKFNGRKVFDRLNIRNKNQQAVEIAYSTLSAICHVTGVIQCQDSSQLHGRPFIAVVIKRERGDEPGSFTNEVKGYKDINGNDPGAAPMGAPQVTSGPTPAWAAPQAPAAAPQQAYAPPPVQQLQAPPAPAGAPQGYAPPVQAAAPVGQPAWAAPQPMPTGQHPAPGNAPPPPPVYTGPPAGPAGAAPAAPPWAAPPQQ